MNLNFYRDFWERAVDFKGRSSRQEFWYTYLVNLVINIACVFLAFIPFLSFIQGIYALAVLIPTLAISVRRLHDSGHSCVPIIVLFVVQFFSMFVFLFNVVAMFFLFLASTDSYGIYFAMMWGSALVLFICTVVHIVLMCLPPTEGMNEYGAMRERIDLKSPSRYAKQNQNYQQYPQQNSDEYNEYENQTGMRFGPEAYSEWMANQQKNQNTNSDNPYFTAYEKTYGQYKEEKENKNE